MYVLTLWSFVARRSIRWRASRSARVQGGKPRCVVHGARRTTIPMGVGEAGEREHARLHAKLAKLESIVGMWRIVCTHV